MSRKTPPASTSNKHVYYFDLLRTVAVFFVIVIHCTAPHFTSLPVGSRSWLVASFFESISRWAVPIFVMISGALHLSKRRDMKSFFKKNVLKILIILLSWNLIYAIVGLINGSSFSSFIKALIGGHYHLWFLYMLLALYALTPFIKKFIKDPKRLKLFLFISFIFGIALPQLTDVLTLLPSPFSSVGNGLSRALNSFGFGQIIGYGFYYVLGYYLHQKKNETKTIRTLYVTGAIYLVFTFFATWCFSAVKNVPTVIFLKDLTINNALMSAGLFVFAKHHVTKKSTSNLLIRASKYSLGIYVMHALLLENVFVFLPSMPICLSVLVKSILCFFVCLMLTFCLRKIPLLKRIV